MEPTATAAPSRADRVARGAFAVVLFLAIFTYPNPPAMELDASWRMALTTALVEGWQFGRDIVFTYGPLGFLMGNTYSGVVFWPFLAWQAATAAAFTAVIYRQGLRLTGYGRAFYWGAMILLCIGYTDALIMVVMLTVAAELVRDAGRPQGLGTAAAVMGFAVLAAVKFTNLLAAGFVILVVAALELHLRRPAAAARLVLGYGLAFLAIWVACGQNPLNLPAYIANSLEISSGYEQTMGIASPAAPFWKGVVVFCALVAYAVTHLATQPDRARALAACLVLGAFTLLNWKHGFVRADGHMVGFFICALVPITAYPALLDDGPRWRGLQRALLVPAGVLCVLGMYDALPGMVRGALGTFQEKVYANVYNTVHLARRYDYYRESLRGERTVYDLPKTRAVVGRGTVDVLGYLQAVALFNRFNYQPRPVIQSYSAYTPALAALNAEYYASDRAPDFVLFRLETIDERYVMVDDARALQVFLNRYTFVHSEKGYQLWRRLDRPFDAAAIAPRPLRSLELPVGAPLDLASFGRQPLWIEIDLPRSGLGRIRDFLYKPAFVRLSLKDADGNTTIYRLPTPLGRAGFLVSPMVEDIVGFMELTGGTPGRWAAEATLLVDEKDRFLFGPAARVTVSTVPIARHGTDYFIEAQKTRFHMFQAIPISFESQTPLSESRIDGQPVMVVHARGEMTFNLKEGATRATGSFGFIPGAYSDGGNTDGAEFIVFWSAGGERQELFRRRLDPVRQAADRGLHTFDVRLPEQPGGRLFLRTSPGPSGNFSWDWTAWTGITIE